MRSPRNYPQTTLSRALLVACAALPLPSLANDECGAATPGGQVICNPTADPVPRIRYDGVTDFEVILKSGVVVDGTLLPERETAVTVYGDGDVSLYAEDGTVIRNEAWPAVDVGSTSGSVNVRVDQVHGGAAGVAAVAGGDVSVWANYVEGEVAIMATSLGGNVSVDVAGVRSNGDGGAGVWAATTSGDVQILAGEAIAEGHFSSGLLASTQDGSVAIEAGYVRAEGVGATAIRAESWDNGDVAVDVNTATASGDGSDGVIAAAGSGDIGITADWVSTQGHSSLGIGAFAFNGSVFVDVEGVGTDGDYSRGVDISAFGQVAVRNGSVFTTGTGSDAINIETVGDVGVQSQRLTTYGSDSYGLRILTSDDVAIDVDEITTFGERSAALFASSGNGDVSARVGRVRTLATSGDWFAIGLGAWNGDAELLVEEEVRAESGYAITMASSTGGARVGVAEGATVYGEAVAIDSATATGTRIDIAGTVESASGPVIKVAGNDWGKGAADIRIGSTGTVRGRLELSGGDDNVANAGTFASSGTSLFGAGEDTFVNVGQVVLQGDATSMAFSGLERFENAGRISLVNGRTGDTITMDGTLDGAPGGTLAVDVDILNGTSDLIKVGALSGTNALELELIGRGPLLGMTGIPVLTSQGTQSGNELVLADGSHNIGFIGFRLDYDGRDSWTLESDLTDEAYLASALPAGVRDLWRQGVQSVSTHLASTPEPRDGNGVWFQVLGGDFEGTSNLSHSLGSRALEWQGTHHGVQMGAEMMLGSWRAGITGGYGKAAMGFGGGEETRLDSVNIGLYAQFARDGWFASAVLRGERVDLDTDWESIGLVDQDDGSVAGLELEAGRRFALSRMWIEPVAKMSWISVRLPEQSGQGGDVRWDDSALSTGELGLRMGVAEGWKGMHPYASMSITHEFGNGDQTTYVTGAETVQVSDDGGRTSGRFGAGAQWRVGRVDLYGEVDARVGDMEGLGGRIGARVLF